MTLISSHVIHPYCLKISSEVGMQVNPLESMNCFKTKSEVSSFFETCLESRRQIDWLSGTPFQTLTGLSIVGALPHELRFASMRIEIIFHILSSLESFLNRACSGLFASLFNFFKSVVEGYEVNLFCEVLKST